MALADLAPVRLLPEPAGGYFGTKKANEPLHILYSYDDHSIAVVNSTYKPIRGMKAAVRVVDFNLKELFSQERTSMSMLMTCRSCCKYRKFHSMSHQLSISFN